jgi:hypothetical protein
MSTYKDHFSAGSSNKSSSSSTDNFALLIGGAYRQVRRDSSVKAKAKRKKGQGQGQGQGQGLESKNTTISMERNNTSSSSVNENNGDDNDNLVTLTPEERSKLEKTMLFCFGSLFKFDATLVGGEKFTSTAQMRATPPPAVLEFGRDPLPELILDSNVLPDSPLVYGRTSSSIWGDVHPYLEVPINLHYAWRLLNYQEVFVLTMRYGLKRSVTEIGHSMGFKGTATRPVNIILDGALLKLAPALLDLPVPVPVQITLED